MGPVDYIAQPASSITMTKPFSKSLSVHVPHLAAPTPCASTPSGRRRRIRISSGSTAAGGTVWL
jgi:hypothetical protein